MSRVERLRRAGFDKSYAVPFKKTWRVRCSACEVVCINGIPCHETGCPNQARARQQCAVEEAEADG